MPRIQIQTLDELMAVTRVQRVNHGSTIDRSYVQNILRRHRAQAAAPENATTSANSRADTPGLDAAGPERAQSPGKASQLVGFNPAQARASLTPATCLPLGVHNGADLTASSLVSALVPVLATGRTTASRFELDNTAAIEMAHAVAQTTAEHLVKLAPGSQKQLRGSALASLASTLCSDWAAFRALPSIDVCCSLLSASHVVSVRPGAVVAARGERADHLAIVLLGEVRVQIDNGRGFTDEIPLRAGRAYGTHGLLTGQPRMATVVSGPDQAVGHASAVLVVTPAAVFEKMLRRVEERRVLAVLETLLNYAPLNAVPAHELLRDNFYFSQHAVSRGDVVVQAHVPSPHLLWVLDGELHVTLPMPGEHGEQGPVVATLSAGTCVGMEGLKDLPSPYMATVSSTRATVLAVQSDKFSAKYGARVVHEALAEGQRMLAGWLDRQQVVNTTLHMAESVVASRPSSVASSSRPSSPLRSPTPDRRRQSSAGFEQTSSSALAFSPARDSPARALTPAGDFESSSKSALAHLRPVSAAPRLCAASSPTLAPAASGGTGPRQSDGVLSPQPRGTPASPVLSPAPGQHPPPRAARSALGKLRAAAAMVGSNAVANNRARTAAVLTDMGVRAAAQAAAERAARASAAATGGAAGQPGVDKAEARYEYSLLTPALRPAVPGGETARQTRQRTAAIAVGIERVHQQRVSRAQARAAVAGAEQVAGAWQVLGSGAASAASESDGDADSVGSNAGQQDDVGAPTASPARRSSRARRDSAGSSPARARSRGWSQSLQAGDPGMADTSDITAVLPGLASPSLRSSSPAVKPMQLTEPLFRSSTAHGLRSWTLQSGAGAQELPALQHAPAQRSAFLTARPMSNAGRAAGSGMYKFQAGPDGKMGYHPRQRTLQALSEAKNALRRRQQRSACGGVQVARQAPSIRLQNVQGQLLASGQGITNMRGRHAGASTRDSGMAATSEGMVLPSMTASARMAAAGKSRLAQDWDELAWTGRHEWAEDSHRPSLADAVPRAFSSLSSASARASTAQLGVNMAPVFLTETEALDSGSDSQAELPRPAGPNPARMHPPLHAMPLTGTPRPPHEGVPDGSERAIAFLRAHAHAGQDPSRQTRGVLKAVVDYVQHARGLGAIDPQTYARMRHALGDSAMQHTALHRQFGSTQAADQRPSSRSSRLLAAQKHAQPLHKRTDVEAERGWVQSRGKPVGPAVQQDVLASPSREQGTALSGQQSTGRVVTAELGGTLAVTWSPSTTSKAILARPDTTPACLQQSSSRLAPAQPILPQLFAAVDAAQRSHSEASDRALLSAQAPRHASRSTTRTPASAAPAGRPVRTPLARRAMTSKPRAREVGAHGAEPMPRPPTSGTVQTGASLDAGLSLAGSVSGWPRDTPQPRSGW